MDGLVDQVPEHEAGEVCVKLLVPRNQLVVEVEDGHLASLFQDLVALLELIHWSTHCTFFMSGGTVFMALRSSFLSFLSLMVSMWRLYISLKMFSIIIWKP